VATLSYAMLVFERPIGPNTNLDLFENSIWLIIITMTTVGMLRSKKSSIW